MTSHILTEGDSLYDKDTGLRNFDVLLSRRGSTGLNIIQQKIRLGLLKADWVKVIPNTPEAEEIQSLVGSRRSSKLSLDADFNPQVQAIRYKYFIRQMKILMDKISDYELSNIYLLSELSTTQEGASGPEMSDEEKDVEERNDPILSYAIAFNYKDIVEVLLRRGADPNIRNSHNETPLHFALGGVSVESDSRSALVSINNLEHRKEIVCLLLQYGADDSLVSDEGLNPFNAATKSKYKIKFETKKTLLEQYNAIKQEALSRPSPPPRVISLEPSIQKIKSNGSRSSWFICCWCNNNKEQNEQYDAIQSESV